MIKIHLFCYISLLYLHLCVIIEQDMRTSVSENPAENMEKGLSYKVPAASPPLEVAILYIESVKYKAKTPLLASLWSLVWSDNKKIKRTPHVLFYFSGVRAAVFRVVSPNAQIWRGIKTKMSLSDKRAFFHLKYLHTWYIILLCPSSSTYVLSFKYKDA